MSASRRTFGIAIISSMQMRPKRTCRSRQYQCIYGLSSFNFAPFFVSIQSRSSLRMASLLDNDAISDLLYPLPMMLSKVSICGLGVRGVLKPADVKAKLL